ncbi:MAG TPA: efflux RND transporter periplasmic adaptor subunit [Anaerolineales bacterium]|nr:efflux RND transporter periplasmic adaptor subunit [Anaerolineales bacterium]
MRNFFKRNRTLLIILVIAVVGISAFLYVRGANADPASQFQTSTVERGSLTATIGATGTVRPKQSSILVWQAAGTVENVHVSVGDTVRAQDVLAELEKTSLPQSIILAEADLASAQKTLEDLTSSNTPQAEAVVNLRAAQEAYDKALNYYDSLFKPYEIDQIVYRRIMTPMGIRRIPDIKTIKVKKADEETIKESGEDLALAEARLQDAQRAYELVKDGNTAEIIAAQARVDAALATINLARLTAPFAATVTESLPLPGDQVAAGATAFRLDDLTRLFVDVEVSEVDINSVQIGQPVTLTFDAILGREYHGEVVEVSQVGTDTQGVVNFKVTVELNDADANVKPGMTAAVNIVVEEIQDVVLVPNRAVRLVDGERVVYLLEEGEPVMKELRLGSSSDTMSVVAVGDIKEGDVVILNPPAAEFGPGGPGGGGFD